MDITHYLDVFREVRRHLWNSALFEEGDSLPDHEVQDCFAKIEGLLFAAIVLSRCGKMESASLYGNGVMEFLRVEPSSGSIPILVRRDGCRYFDRENDLTGGDPELAFVSVFDWDTSGFLESEYYLVRVTASCTRPHLVGRDALVASRHVRVVFRDDTISGTHS